jgi:DASH complex subunit DAD3
MTTLLPSPVDIFSVNPYEGHLGLSQLEADVLWEYAKLAQHVKLVFASHRRNVVQLFIPFTQVTLKTRSLSEQPDQSMLARLRVLEQKMGLVLTLVSSFLSLIRRGPCFHPFP